MESILNFFESQTSPILQALYAGLFTWILTAFGADVKGYKGRENHVDLFVGSELAPRFFGWGIPTGPNEGRIGIATTLPHKPMPFFRVKIASSDASFGRILIFTPWAKI